MFSGERELYEFADFRLDVSERLFLRQNERIHLSDKAFEILCLLVRQNGHLVGKNEILAEVWADTIVEDNNLDKNVSRLRKAFGKGNEKFIETVRGHGYRFVAEVTKIEPDESFQKLEIALPNTNFTAKKTPSQSEYRIERAGNVVALADWRSEPDESEKTPEDLPVVETAKETSLPRRKKYLWAGTIAFALLVLAFGFFVLKRFGAETTTSDAPIKTIAVLPFKPLVAENRNESLELGMTDMLINKLSSNGGEIIVRPLGSIRKFNSLEQDSLAAGRELGVDSVLEGTIQMADERIRITARLVRTNDGKQLWTGQFDEKFTDIFAVQDSISERVAAALKIRLEGREKKRYTENIEAYQFYMKGRFHVLKLKRAETLKAISYYQEAIKVDPNYALAYVGLAEANRAMALTGEMSPIEFFPQAKAAAQRAIELDDELAEAHSALGFIIFWYDHDWNEAEKQYKRALELNPNSAETHQAYAQLFFVTERQPEGLAAARRARELDPLNLRIGSLEAQFLIFAGQTDEALLRLEKIFELDPNFWFAHYYASSAYIAKGMYGEAITEARKAREFSDGNAYPTAFLGYALAKSGKQSEARAELEALLKLSNERYVPPDHIAMIYNGLGETDKTLEWLDRCYRERNPRMVFLKVEPKWNNLHDDPRFADLLRRVGLQ
jgi:DNA-binding winged helix-turn-helix (wHTH) protein/TolB-like protein/Flp pilus assembly protein TadD